MQIFAVMLGPYSPTCQLCRFMLTANICTICIHLAFQRQFVFSSWHFFHSQIFEIYSMLAEHEHNLNASSWLLPEMRLIWLGVDNYVAVVNSFSFECTEQAHPICGFCFRNCSLAMTTVITFRQIGVRLISVDTKQIVVAKITVSRFNIRRASLNNFVCMRQTIPKLCGFTYITCTLHMRTKLFKCT